MSEAENKFGPRLMTAAQVAGLVGVSSRLVREWADPNGQYQGRCCPSDLVDDKKGPRGQKSRRFNIDEVRAWCEREGLGRRGRQEKKDPPGQVTFTLDGAVVEGAGVGEGPRAEGRGPREDAGGAAPVGGAGGLVAPTVVIASADDALRSVAEMIAALQAVVFQLVQAGNRAQAEGKLDGLSAETLRKVADSATTLSAEARLLRKAEDDARVRRGELVARESARQTVEGVVTAAATAMRNVPREAAVEVLGDAVIAAALTRAELERETAERLLVAAINRVVERAQAAAAEALEKSAGVGVGGGGDEMRVGVAA